MIPLDNQTRSASQQETQDGLRFRPVPSNGVCALLSDKWTIPVLWRLSLAEGHRLRFSALKREVDGITQRMLTLALRNLERNGLVARHYFPEIPPRVEYEATELGRNALRGLEEFNIWLRNNLPEIEHHRRAYDAAER
ncbi:MAG: transcriptional regulator [Rhizobiales bacterium]|nr:transcriptional regulator [Hyphomicrobiales bacterium]|tara:strand:- start:307 stop:720 length:414 start_codon:yes stop_codon:yes gene_type:complete